MTLNAIWADPMWRELLRLARSVPARAVLGYDGGATALDPFQLDDVLFTPAAGRPFGAAYVAAFVDLERRFVLVSGRCETTIGNGTDRWEPDSVVDVQYAGTLVDLVRLAMTTEERERLDVAAHGYTV